MHERIAAEEARLRDDETLPAEGIRVTDRRRINFDETSGNTSTRTNEETSSLKPTYVEELEARTRAAEQKAADVQARFEQVRAELRRETDEIKQRLARTAEERVEREKAAFVAALLPVLDNLLRAIEAAEDGGSMEALLNGLHGTANGFENALGALGVEPVAALGEQFDPQLHEAVDTTKVEPARDNTITAEYSRGYRMNNHLIRPARVQVGRMHGGEAQSAAE